MTLDQNLKELYEGIMNYDTKAVRTAAHNIKGTTGYIKANRLSD
eukprot:CAMPEP_0114598638 /NCGR_PEP_ID=MMETSP0125-20121206/21042_1 /TAXON_ID=485358 ORGANISM="Aristerostoma sp., Strain ATCC 50986" /NCGR_SAMPLE_ID=MMETSP0125 /ASSEMBLY_ACC=CAM_ASM_000245 /LENGTH=43 /DNA_ID= /DNA_START= /DNA_END= /DNA_ORIENTATION=